MDNNIKIYVGDTCFIVDFEDWKTVRPWDRYIFLVRLYRTMWSLSPEVNLTLFDAFEENDLSKLQNIIDSIFIKSINIKYEINKLTDILLFNPRFQND